jgi:DNA (cytosine-5)-methyltransferase 1
MNAVSLFAGVGGFDLALERAGIPVVAAVEWDKNASGVLAHRFPNTKLFGDVQEVTGDDLRGAGFVPDTGILTGGFPCQDLSVAGKRAGLAGERSGMFWQITRLVQDLQPQWLILENVPGLLSSNGGRDMGTVLGALAECGYGIGYRVLDAQFFGIPQRRRRVFIVGCLGDDGRAPAKVLALSESVRGDSSTGRAKGKEAAGGVGPSVAGSGAVAERERERALVKVVGTLSQGAHPGGFNGQDAYTGQLIIESLDRQALSDTPRVK